jgi:hypothetical protein
LFFFGKWCLDNNWLDNHCLFPSRWWVPLTCRFHPKIVAKGFHSRSATHEQTSNTIEDGCGNTQVRTRSCITNQLFIFKAVSREFIDIVIRPKMRFTKRSYEHALQAKEMIKYVGSNELIDGESNKCGLQVATGCGAENEA